MRYAIGLIVAIVIYLVLARFYGNQPQPPAKPAYATVDEMMVHFAKTAEQWMKKEQGINLDYSMDSIQIVQVQLDKLANEITQDKTHKKRDEEAFNWALGYGAYLGEIVRRREGGSWAADHPVGGQRSYPLTTTNNTMYFPVVWCWKLLTGGASESFIKDEIAKAQTNQTGSFTFPTNTPPIPPAPPK